MNLNSKIFQQIPDASVNEVAFISQISANWDEAKLQNYLHFYNSERTKPDTMLILILIGFLGIAGINRFVMGQIGLGILYLLTGGLCIVGTIIDAVNYKKLADENNQHVANSLMFKLGLN